MSRRKAGNRRRGKKSGGLTDTRTTEEKDQEDTAMIHAYRAQGDPASSIALSSLLFSHKTIYLQPSQVATKSDGTMGFYTVLHHFPDDEAEPTASATPGPNEPTSSHEAEPTASSTPGPSEPTPSLPSVGFVKARSCFNPRSACLNNELQMLNDKIDDLDTEFQTIKVNLDFDSENMSESDKAELTFKQRDLSRALAVERASVDSLKEDLAAENDKGIAVVYSTACTEGRVLTTEDIIEFFVPPDEEVLAEEKKDIDQCVDLEQKNVEDITTRALLVNADYEQDLLRIAELKAKKGELKARLKFRAGARFLDSF